MADALIVVNFVISKDVVILENSELKIAGTLTLGNKVFIEENKQVWATVKHKGIVGYCSHCGKGKLWFKGCRFKRDICWIIIQALRGSLA